jgi:MtN3 and saliva related transmembrane protein
MLPQTINIMGYMGGIITTLGGIPQIIQMARTKKTQDLNWTMLGCWVTGLSMTLLYGLYIHRFPICLSASASLIMTIVMGWMKLKYESENTDNDTEMGHLLTDS